MREYERPFFFHLRDPERGVSPCFCRWRICRTLIPHVAVQIRIKILWHFAVSQQKAYAPPPSFDQVYILQQVARDFLLD